jgi:protease-4
MKRRTFWVLTAGVLVVAVGAAALGGLALWLRRAGHAPAALGSRSYLDVRLDGLLPERPPAEEALPFERQPPSLRTYVASLDRARNDANVSAVMLRIGSLPDAGWGKIQELRAAVQRFRTSGKPVYAYLESVENKEYYLASACDKVYALPTAFFVITGLATEVTFFRGGFDKLGVEAEFVGVGKYKNAPNQFTETGFTEPHREQMEALLGNLYEDLVSGIAEGRGKTTAQVQEWIDGGPYDARDAQRLGLVDELLYEDELEARFGDVTRVTPAAYVRSGRGFTGLHFGRPQIAMVYALGEIVDGRSRTGFFGGESAGSQTITAALRRARHDSAVRAVVLRVDSPGGSGTASDAIWREVRLTREVKPLIVSMGDFAASGGYYIAMAGDRIVAEPGTVTGSIGVFGGKFSLRGLYDKLGISKESVTRGRRAGLFSDYRPWTPDEREQVQALMSSFYQDFITRVAQHRNKTVDEVHAIAQGRVWTGKEALKIGLVDELGGLDRALDIAKQRAGIGATQAVDVLVLPERRTFFELLMERQDEMDSTRLAQVAARELLPAEARALLSFASRAHAGPIARLPFELRVR